MMSLSDVYYSCGGKVCVCVTVSPLHRAGESVSMASSLCPPENRCAYICTLRKRACVFLRGV